MTTAASHSETNLLALLSEGDGEAFTQLFNAHWDRVYSVAFLILRSSDLAEDVAQEIFLNIWKNRANAAQIQNFAAYLRTATRNLVFTRIGRLKTEDNYLSMLQKKMGQPQNPDENRLDYKQISTVMEAGIKQLPTQQQKAFRLSREEGMSHKQIAQEMRISTASVKDYIVKALTFMRKHMREYSPLLMILLQAF